MYSALRITQQVVPDNGSYPVGYIFRLDPIKSRPWATKQLARMWPVGYSGFLLTIL
jgi:hypothetical protein